MITAEHQSTDWGFKPYYIYTSHSLTHSLCSLWHILTLTLIIAAAAVVEPRGGRNRKPSKLSDCQKKGDCVFISSAVTYLLTYHQQAFTFTHNYSVYQRINKYTVSRGCVCFVRERYERWIKSRDKGRKNESDVSLWFSVGAKKAKKAVN